MVNNQDQIFEDALIKLDFNKHDQNQLIRWSLNERRGFVKFKQILFCFQEKQRDLRPYIVKRKSYFTQRFC